MLLRRTLADQIADHHQPGGYADPCLQLDGLDIEAAHRVDAGEAGPHPPFGVVLMRLRVTEINQDAITHVPGHKAVGFGDYFGDGTVICADDLAVILGIEARGECRRADQIAEHYRQLSTFGIGRHRHIT